MKVFLQRAGDVFEIIALVFVFLSLFDFIWMCLQIILYRYDNYFAMYAFFGLQVIGAVFFVLSILLAPGGERNRYV